MNTTAGKEHKKEDSDSDDDMVAKVTHAAARCSIQVLQQYFAEQDFSDTQHAVLDMHVDGFFFAKAAFKMKQITLDLFVA